MPVRQDFQGFDDHHLSRISPKDTSFDTHKSASREIARLYGLDTQDGYEGFLSGSKPVLFKDYAIRLKKCGAWLRFVETQDGFKLVDARFCKAPNCPMCQWRRSLKWRAKFLEMLPEVQEQFSSTHKWLFLTLTIRNCDVDDLKTTIKHLNGAFKRLSMRSKFPMIGSVKSVEVTRTWDCYDSFTGSYLGRHGTKWVYQQQQQNNTAIRLEPTNEVHPHLHVVGLVKPSYFSHGYIKHSEWVQMWRKCLKVDYDPIVNIKMVKCRKNQQIIPTPQEFSDNNNTDKTGMIKAICETLKYTVKEVDLIGKGCNDEQANSIWLKKITEQLYKTRKTEYRGVLKDIGKQLEEAYQDNDLINVNEEKELDNTVTKEVVFTWKDAIHRYVTSPD